MNETNQTSESANDGSFGPEKRSAGLAARVTVITLVFIVSVAAILTTVPWLFYRYSHVVVSNATIKGTITKLGARIDDQVKSIAVTTGQHVERGALLIQLEDQHLQAALQRAQAELQAATNELASERLAIADERRRLKLQVERAASMQQSAAADLEGAQSTADNLVKEHDRIAALMKAGIAAASDMDRVSGERGKALADVKANSSLRDAAASSHQAAEVQLEGLRVREAHLGVLTADVAVARAKVAAAEADLAATAIRAPEDGWVIDRIVEVGGSAKVGEPLISLWIGRPWVEGWVTERAIGQLNVGSLVDVSFEAFPGHTLRGRIDAFGLLTNTELEDKPVPSTLDALIHKSAMVPFRVSVEGENLPLRPGLSAVVGIAKTPRETGPDATTVYGQMPEIIQKLASRLSWNGR